MTSRSSAGSTRPSSWAASIGIVLAGGVLDRMPLQRPFAVGLGLFGLGLVIGGLAPSMPVLIAARFLQRLGRCPDPDGVCRDRALPSGTAPAAHVRHAVHGVGGSGNPGPFAGGRRGRAGRVAMGVPGAHSPAGRGRRVGPERASPRARRGAARRGRRAASEGRPATPRRSPGGGRGCGPARRRLRSDRSAGAGRRRGPRRRDPPADVPLAHPTPGRSGSPRVCRPPSSCAA